MTAEVTCLLVPLRTPQGMTLTAPLGPGTHSGLGTFPGSTSKCRAGECQLPSQVQGPHGCLHPTCGDSDLLGCRPSSPTFRIKTAPGDPNVQPRLRRGDWPTDSQTDHTLESPEKFHTFWPMPGRHTQSLIGLSVTWREFHLRCFIKPRVHCIGMASNCTLSLECSKRWF